MEAVVDFYGPVDLTALYNDAPRDDPFLATFLGGTPEQVPGRYTAASVDTYIAPDDPPFFIVQGTTDQTVDPSQSDLLASDLKQAGVPYSLEYLVGLGHGFEFSHQQPAQPPAPGRHLPEPGVRPPADHDGDDGT